MALNHTDRRRVTAAAALTLLALPALWLANTSGNSTAPNVAVAGLEVDDEAAADPEPAAVAAADDTDAAPVFLEGPVSPAGASQSQIAVPAKPLVDGITARATFRSTVPDGTCVVPGLTSGTEITVVNLANNRSVDCRSVLAPGNQVGELVMHTSAFARIADLTDAPISVEIRR